MPPTPRASLRCGRIEVTVAPVLEPPVIIRVVGVAGRFHCAVEGRRIGLVRGRRRQVGAAAEPAFGRHDMARVHVHGRDFRRAHMGDEADPARPEARILRGAGDLAPELFGEFAVDGRDVDADLLEHPAAHQGHHAAAAVAGGVRVGIGTGRAGRAVAHPPASPGRPLEPAGRTAAGQRQRLARQFVLQGFEGRAEAVAQGLEPVPRVVLLGFGAGYGIHDLPVFLHRRVRHRPPKSNPPVLRCRLRGRRRAGWRRRHSAVHPAGGGPVSQGPSRMALPEALRRRIFPRAPAGIGLPGCLCVAVSHFACEKPGHTLDRAANLL